MILRPQVSIGIGCSTRASSEDIIKLIQSCRPATAPASIIASIDHRAAIAALVADALNLHLVVFPSSVLAQIPGVSTHSALALKNSGTANVAEASALASLGPRAHLIVPRRTGRFCTCAIASLPNDGDE